MLFATEIERTGSWGLGGTGMEGRCKFWWSGKVDGISGVGVMAKELCEKVMKRRG